MTREQHRRRLGILAAATVIIVLVGYVVFGMVRGATETRGACENIQDEVQALLTPGAQADDPDQLAASFSTSAATIRDEGRRAGGDVENTADKLATAIDETAAYFRGLSSGTVQPPDYSDVSGVVTEFQEACKSSLPGHG